MFGKVGEPTAFDIPALEQIGIVELDAEHPKKGMMTFTGVLLNDILGACGPSDAATKLICTASDGYSAEVPLADVQACADCMVANRGRPL